MTDPKIIAAAQAAGFKPGYLGHIYTGTSTEATERFYAIAFEDGRVAEREDCAKVCDYHGDDDNGYGCAAAIRARSTK